MDMRGVRTSIKPNAHSPFAARPREEPVSTDDLWHPSPVGSTANTSDREAALAVRRGILKHARHDIGIRLPGEEAVMEAEAADVEAAPKPTPVTSPDAVGELWQQGRSSKPLRDGDDVSVTSGVTVKSRLLELQWEVDELARKVRGRSESDVCLRRSHPTRNPPSPTAAGRTSAAT